MNLRDHLNPIEQAARDMSKFARAAIKATYPLDADVQCELLVSMLVQLEVLKLRCATLQKSKAFKELGT